MPSLAESPCLAGEDLDRRMFQLNILFETVRELSQSPDAPGVMEAFALMSMGALGTARGFLIYFDEQQGKSGVLSRGFSPPAADALNKAVDHIHDVLAEKIRRGAELLPHQARIVLLNEPPRDLCFPRETRVLVEWVLDANSYGYLGYGEKISLEGYGPDDEDFLLRLVSAFMDALEVIQSAEARRRLMDELLEKNSRLEQALADAQSMQQDLDRRYFHFKSLCETTRELSGILDKDGLIVSFLLSIMGIFSAQQGMVTYWDRKEGGVRTVTRGYAAGNAPEFTAESLDALFCSLLHPPFVPASGESRQLVLRGEMLRSLDLPGDPFTAVAFLMDTTHYGLVCLGRRLHDREDQQAEGELLEALVQSFLACLGNAFSFATIQKLNEDLMQKNLELRQTLDELQKSKQTISLLEAARNRISSLLYTETLRLKRVSLLDFVFLGVLSLILALVFNASSPGGVSLVPETWGRPAPEFIDVSWAKLKHASQGALFLDARPVEFFHQKRIAGAENLPLNLFDFVYAMRFSLLDPGTEVIVYGRNISRHYDEIVAAKLKERGMENVRVLAGGLQRWSREGLPVEP